VGEGISVEVGQEEEETGENPDDILKGFPLYTVSK
jgi:hypothetical protein